MENLNDLTDNVNYEAEEDDKLPEKKRKGRGPAIPKSSSVETDDPSELEWITRECGKGWRAQILRTSPSWCDGILETMDLEPGDPVDLEEIRRSWGGRKLHIKIWDERGRLRKRVNFRFPDPPKSNGIALNPPYHPIQNAVSSDSSPTFTLPQQQSDQRYRDLLEMVLQRKEQSSQGDLTKHLIERCQQLELQINALSQRSPVYAQPMQAQAPTAINAGSVDLLAQVVSVIKQVDDLKATLGAPRTAEAADNFLETAARQIIDFELKKRENRENIAVAPEIKNRPLPERERAAPTENEGALSPIIQALKSKIENMPPERLESILDIVMNDIPVDMVEDGEAMDPKIAS